jgi:hypothetical protein
MIEPVVGYECQKFPAGGGGRLSQLLYLEVAEAGRPIPPRARLSEEPIDASLV